MYKILAFVVIYSLSLELSYAKDLLSKGDDYGFVPSSPEIKADRPKINQPIALPQTTPTKVDNNKAQSKEKKDNKKIASKENNQKTTSKNNENVKPKTQHKQNQPVKTNNTNKNKKLIDKNTDNNNNTPKKNVEKSPIQPINQDSKVVNTKNSTSPVKSNESVVPLDNNDSNSVKKSEFALQSNPSLGVSSVDSKSSESPVSNGATSKSDSGVDVKQNTIDANPKDLSTYGSPQETTVLENNTIRRNKVEKNSDESMPAAEDEEEATIISQEKNPYINNYKQ